MQFRDRLFAALAKEIEEAKRDTATNNSERIMALENYHYNVGYWHGLNAVLERMEKIAKKEDGEGE